MQLKGLVRFFAIALILISLYQLSFTFLVRNYEKKIEQQAESDVAKAYPTPEKKYPGSQELQSFYSDTLKGYVKDRRQEILDSTSSKQIAGFPWNVTYTKAKEKELNLGLDLVGGMNVVLEVNVEDVIRALSGQSKDAAFNKALERANELKKTNQADFVTLFGQAYSEIAPQGRLANIFANAYQKDITFNSTNAQVLDMIRRESKVAIKNTYIVLQKRIDKFGVAQPNISLDENKGLISVELAGVDNAARVHKYLQATANLEFRDVYKNSPDFFQNVLVPMNEAIKNASVTPAAAAPATTDTTATAANNNAADTSKDGSLSSFIKKTGKDSASSSKELQLQQAQKENPLFMVLHPNYDPQSGSLYPSPSIGSILPKDTATFNRYMQIPAVKNLLPKDAVFAFGAENKQDKYGPISVYVLKVNPANPTPRVGGESIVDARQDFDQHNRPEISMTMDNIGAHEWRKWTNELKPADPNNPASYNYVAVVLDNIVYSAPSIQSEIAGGRSSISGSFTVEEANDLANILKSGKMPAPAQIVQEQIVGPTLGAESIAAGAKSFMISFVIIFVLMLVYYNTAGWVANIALILNLLYTFGILASMGATLTMAGIAGMVLTIGMAVDTNVIIFERIKDELTHGRSYADAVSHGYKRSYAPVLDGHITSLLTAIILFYFGLGPVLGFATTQIIGLILSLFCGIMVSRMVTDFWMKKKRHFEYFTPISRKIFKHAAFDFVGKRKIAYIISGFVMLAGISSFFHGFDHGIDFSGGRNYTVRFERPMNRQEIADQLEKEFESEVFVKTIGSTNQLSITTSYKIEQQNQDVDKEVAAKLYNGLKKYYDASVTPEVFSSRYIVGSQTVSPTISDDLRAGAVKATILSLVVIFLYILLRFSKWQYSIGTIFSLLHDVMVILAVFSWCRSFVPFTLEIDQHFIAAILTVIGFSMNDTVIVFDRIREYFKTGEHGRDRNKVINKAINDTLSRTIMTSLTVFLTILILFIFGGEVTRGFAFAMLVGVITGTYSSIFVAAPVLVDFDKKNQLSNESESVDVTVKKASPATK
ncbi:SecD/SecF fusion protein [Chitinophaga terrae (ex Kim and Jung 2007)]|uniref:Multifunctional fusion protein n=1 Tax=Chitinophaga terrae (ex Kim and Jung 2007) TaxID=408074 RepID=A0A1H3WZ75_9BACT|nr:protein translocase subunit SecDF [Chitinophaga terrae (ex Kim and Jung 2007)]GEP90216.1 protein translocase subunit SecDF [Chitinophaga terrae (ex Kim and Jung 2007)]SDZ92465.1 SecD/SecF fusion protein [Chitinophaga terrae (ex Kim and Jung 2007)]